MEGKGTRVTTYVMLGLFNCSNASSIVVVAMPRRCSELGSITSRVGDPHKAGDSCPHLLGIQAATSPQAWIAQWGLSCDCELSHSTTHYEVAILNTAARPAGSCKGSFDDGK